MQGDGNLVIYGPGGVYIWDTKTHNNPGSRLIVQDDGNVVIYKPDDTPIWATNTQTVRLGYETGNISSGWEWGSSQYPNNRPDRLTKIDKNSIQPPSPDPNGTAALKVTLKSGDLWTDSKGNSTARAEVLTTGYPHFTEGSVVHYHWYTMFPEGAFPAQDKWEVWTQWHQSNDSADWPPDLQFVYNNEKIELQVYNALHDPKKVWVDTRNIIRSHWYDINLFVKWSTDSSRGFVELWVDGEIKTRKTNFTTLDPNYPPSSCYMKQGLYRDRAIQVDQTIYHDGMEFSYLPLQIVWSDVL